MTKNYMKFIKEEHKLIKNYLSELKKSINESYINYKKVSHLFKELNIIWDTHEEKEEAFFSPLRKSDMQIENVSFNHRELKGHKKVISNAIDSKNPEKIRIALDTDGRMLLEKLNEHLNYEKNIMKIKPIPYTFQESSDLRMSGTN